MPAFSFRRVTRDDLPMLLEWMHRPHTRWDPPGTIEELADKLLPDSPDPSAAAPYIAYARDEPIGYIQSYVAAYAGDGWWPDVTDPGVVGTDQFLADPARLDQGLGTAMVSAFIDRLFADPKITLIQVDPAPDNARAIRSYEKVGFRRVGIVETPDGPAMLMHLRRSG